MGKEHKQPAGEHGGASLLEQSIRLGRQENAIFMNRLRVVLAVSFTAVYIFGILRVENTSLGWTIPHMLIWVGASILLWLLGNRLKPLLGASRFAVAFLDVPMATWIQYNNVLHSEKPELTAVFTVAIFTFMIAMSSFSLRPRHLILTASICLAGLFIVYSADQVSIIFYIAGTTILLVTAIMMSWIPIRQTQLIQETAERKARRNRLASYFSPGVAEMIESRDDPGLGERCEISVLFCDIRGFTRLSEKLDATEVVELLNGFYDHMVEAVFRYGGTLDKYLGDGLLAYFNSPVPQTDHARRAIDCAIAMTDSLKDLNRIRGEKGFEPLKIGIGIHSGVAVVGNIGASQRREFTAIGDTVNVASRIESLTKEFGETILASEEVVSQIENSKGIKFEPAPDHSVELRGREKAIQLFVPRFGRELPS